ncbi:hypothetical protein [Halobacterium yunchengense]|uniref:hypothetical protein n=1 Tax=Halobacterium yunchengense TaxID=3108497 RepID=UPI00300AD40D
MTDPLPALAASGAGELVLALVVPVVLVAVGTYVGVLLALQSFFDASSWEEATTGDAGE